MKEQREQKDPTRWNWKRKDGSKVRMIDMDEKHLLKAFDFVCRKELEYHNLCSIHGELRDKLEKIASIRGIEVKYPDQTNPDSGFGPFFNNIRKTKLMPKEVKLASETPVPEQIKQE